MTRKPAQSAPAGPRPELVSAAELQTKKFPPPSCYIEGMIYAGLTLLAGRPKLGKSWLALRAAVTVATGGVAFGNPHRAVNPTSAIFLGLEDGEARLQGRLATLLLEGESWPPNLQVATLWPRFDAGGIDALASVIDEHQIGLVVVDTLARVRPPGRGRDRYQEDSDAISAVQDLTRRTPGLAVILVHHLRKGSAEDYVDAVSGTAAITGVADHIAVLTRGRGDADAVLDFTSRDAPEHSTAFGFEGGHWTEIGPAAAHQESKARRQVLDSVRSLQPVSLSAVAEDVGKDRSQIRRMLVALSADGLVSQDGSRGPWSLAQSNGSNPVQKSFDWTNGPNGLHPALAPSSSSSSSSRSEEEEEGWPDPF